MQAQHSTGGHYCPLARQMTGLDDKAEPHFLLQILDFRSCEERGVMCRIVKSKSKGRIGDGC